MSEMRLHPVCLYNLREFSLKPLSGKRLPRTCSKREKIYKTSTRKAKRFEKQI